MLHALLGKLMEGLTDEYGPGKPSMNPNRFAAAFDYWSDTRVFLDVRSVSPARAIRTEQGKKTRSQLFSCSRKIFETVICVREDSANLRSANRQLCSGALGWVVD